MINYRSKFEQGLARQLEKAGVDFDYEKESYEYTLVKKYTPDFFLPNGIIIEAKGKFTSEDRRKHLVIKEHYPQLDIRFVFMRDNRLRKNSSTNYSDWAYKNGYNYYIGEVPKEWLREGKV